MNHHETGTQRASRTTTSSATPTPTKLQRARVFASTYWRCFARSSSASCCARSAASGMQEKMARARSEEHTSELQSPCNLVCRLLLEKKKTMQQETMTDVDNR